MNRKKIINLVILSVILASAISFLSLNIRQKAIVRNGKEICATAVDSSGYPIPFRKQYFGTAYPSMLDIGCINNNKPAEFLWDKFILNTGVWLVITLATNLMAASILRKRA